MKIRNRKQSFSHLQNSYSQLEKRQLMAADLSATDTFTVQPRIEFTEIQWGEETRLAKSGQWLIWQTDHGVQTQNSLQVGSEKSVSLGSSFSHYSTANQKLTVTDKIASGLFILSGADDWTYETVADSVAQWLPNAVVEPNFIVNVDSVPNDSDFGDQWGLNNTGQNGGLIDADIDAVEAWDISTGNSDVLVAVIDTGVDYTHPDLVDNIWVNPGEIAGDGIDNDGNGFIDDIHGWDFANDDNDPMDDRGHGTHVAGTIGAAGNNNLGVTGVSQNVTIVPVKFLGANGGTTADAIRAIEYTNTLKQQGHNIVLTNNSWGGASFSSSLEVVIEDALDLDILFVAAAGNSGNSSRAYPAAYDTENVISVAATNRFDQIATFSNFDDTWVDIAAPGVDILSTALGGGYEVLSGTSMASPHVAGALALLAAAEPDLSALELRDRLFERVDILPQLEDLVATSGRLNAFSLVDPSFFRDDGKIEFISNSFSASNSVGIELTDTGGFSPDAEVVIESSSGDREIITVSPTGGFTFSASIKSAVGTANVNDGVLQVASGDLLTASYLNVDNGMGAQVTTTDTAAIFTDDHGNDADSATPIEFDLVLAGRTESATDQDWFSFEATTRVRYRFEALRGNIGNTSVSIYDTDGTTLLAFDDFSAARTVGPSVSWIPESAGTYYVVVGQADDNTGNYELSGRTTTQQGSVSFDDVTYTTTSTINIELFDANNFEPNATVIIETSSGDIETLVITPGITDFSTSISAVAGLANSEDGILQVAPGDELRAIYRDTNNGFGIGTGGLSTYFADAIIYPDDHGNDAPNATPIVAPSNTAGELEHAADPDWFQFDAVAGNVYQFETILGSLNDSTLTLYDTDGTTQLAFDNDSGDGFASLLRWRAPENGSYYLAVQTFSAFPQAGTYQLTADSFLLGDVNQDGNVDFLDISPFISLLQTSDYLLEADINNDGEVNFLDISPFITLLS